MRRKDPKTKNSIFRQTKVPYNPSRVINACNCEIICVAEGFGSVHDFKLFKMSKTNKCFTQNQYNIGYCYIGITKLHENSTIPCKESKCHKLTDLKKLKNAIIQSSRISIEYTNVKLKRFKIPSNKYRNKQNSLFDSL